MRAVHQALTGRSGRSGNAYAAVVIPSAPTVEYGDIMQAIDGTEYYVVKATPAGGGEWRVTTVDATTWRAVRTAEQIAAGMIQV